MCAHVCVGGGRSKPHPSLTLSVPRRPPLAAGDTAGRRPRCLGSSHFVICGHWVQKINGHVLKIHTDLESARENTDLN